MIELGLAAMVIGGVMMAYSARRESQRQIQEVYRALSASSKQLAADGLRVKDKVDQLSLKIGDLRAEVGSIRQCPKCGYETRRHGNFCPACGHFIACDQSAVEFVGLLSERQIRNESYPSSRNRNAG